MESDSTRSKLTLGTNNLQEKAMIDTPEVLATQPLACAKIYQIVPSSEIQSVMGKTLQELKAGIQEQGITITGP